MAYSFYYGSIIVILLLLFFCMMKKGAAFSHLVIAITAMGYSLLFETVFGEYFDLYYYINPTNSLLYIIISAVTLYPAIEVIYVLFLPERLFTAALYTLVWIAAMLAFEMASLYTSTVVFTGWHIYPWSIITYIITFSWINLLYRYLKKRGL